MDNRSNLTTIASAALVVSAVTMACCAVNLVSSVRKFNKVIQNIDFAGIRKSIRHNSEMIEIR